MEAIFKALCKGGKVIPVNPDDIYKYAIEHDEQEIYMTCKPVAKTSEKLRMYAYWHTAILECAVIGYTYAGYELIDKVKADYLLRAEFAKDFIRKPNGEYQPIMLNKDKMTKTRMLKLMTDAIFFIENELQQTVPDSQEWKLKKQTGRDFKKVM